jgi:hypothetical protein
MINIAHFWIRPLNFTNGHGRYMAVTPERTIFRWGMAATYSRFKFSFRFYNGYVTAVLLLKTPLKTTHGGFRSETATWT